MAAVVPEGQINSPLDVMLQWSIVIYEMVFIEDHGFQKHRKDLLADDELFELFIWLSVHAAAGRIIPGSGGLRKVRWAGKGHGKRGGVRIIYFWWLADDKILLLDIYPKNAREDLSAAEIEKLKQKVIK